MTYNNDTVHDLKIAYIGGGSRGWAWTFMKDLALEPALSGTIRLYDIDAPSAEKNEIIGNRITERDDALGKWNYVTVPTLKDALADIDFIVISILPGTFDEMDSDVHLPERHGIYQSVGDTAGPGGIIRSLRTIPLFVEIAEAIKAYAPKAWVINYTNPMSLCVKTLYDVFPEIKAFGCCHEVFGTQKVLKGILEEELKIENIDRRDIAVNVLGINHFTWFDYASYKNIDILPIYKQYIKEHFEDGYLVKDEHWANDCFVCRNRVKFDMFEKYGLVAAAGDRHLAEFVSGDIYLRNPETVAEWKFGLTSVDWRKEDLNNRIEKSSKILDGEEVELKSSGEEGILLIKALCGLGHVVSNVNLPNSCNQISNLPASAIVETNALFERDAIRPIFAGKLPEEILNLITPHIENHETVLEATKTYDKQLVIKAFSNDPLVKGKCSQEEVEILVDDMIRNTLKYLPEQWGKNL